MLPMKLVYAYAPADERFRKELSSHLHPLVQQGLISEWYEQLIPAGADSDEERRRAWDTADLLLLLLSADYFLSNAYDEQALQRALARHQSGQLLLIPVVLRPCDWQATMIGHLQSLPRDGRPLTRQEDRDAALLAIEQEIRQRVTARQVPKTVLSAGQRTSRQRLLKLMRTIWIEDMLEKLLHHATWVDLHLQKEASGPERSWHLMVQELDRGPRPLPAGTSIIQVFDEADEELLILGEPGSGKTTLLLYLARTLLERAEADERRRMPVLFNLSSWARQQLPLAQWLVEELQVRYQVPQKIGRMWVETNQIFPLLDGLDEMAESARPACVQAITTYTQREQERISLIVSCRIEEYQSLPMQLPLYYAVMLLPFTDEQMEVYLSSISGPTALLRQVLRADEELFELAHRPLMLSIFTTAYADAEGDASDLVTTTAHADYPRVLFQQYVKRMLKRRTHLHQGTEEQFRRWLTYFATQLHRQQQTIFAVEELQPTWLPERYQVWYRRMMMLAYALTFGLLFGPVFGLAFGGVYGFIFRTPARLLFGTLFGLVLGVVGGLSGGLAFGLAFRQHQRIQPAEIARWSWTATRRGLLIGIGAGLLFGLLGLLVVWVTVGPAAAVVVAGILAVIFGVVGGGVGGFVPTQMAERILLAPNEGIWRSGRRGLFAVLIFVLVIGPVAGIVVGRFGASITQLAYALLFGLLFGTGGGLIFGLLFDRVGGRTGIAAFLQHFVLRLLLWRLDLLPRDLVAFLDEATERLLLRKVGGSYFFVHRLLRDVLATQSEDASSGNRS